jgi:4'-phosphopantetheinyl transferase
MTPVTIHWTLGEGWRAPLEEYAAFLSNAEQQKLSSLRFPKRRHEWLLGRWTAKSLVHSLPEYHHFLLDQIEIQNMPEGSPRIILPDEKVSRGCLSISHREDLAFCVHAEGPKLRIGADLEKIEARPKNFAEDYFMQAEQRIVTGHPDSERDFITTLIWSAKEAMLKALGVGLRWDTRKVEVTQIGSLDVEPGAWNSIRVMDHSEARPWSAWWQRRDELVLTLAGYDNAPMDWVMAEIKV